MADKQHLDLLQQGAKIWNEWREHNPDIQPDLREANLPEVNLQGFNLFRAHLEKTNLQKAHLEGSNLREAHLEGANLQGAHLEAKLPTLSTFWDMFYNENLSNSPTIDQFKLDYAQTVLGAADLRQAFFDSSTNLTDIILASEIGNSYQINGSAFIADISWNDVNLAVVDWTQLNKLGDELLIHISDDNRIQLDTLRSATRAYRQLVTILQSQGLNEASSHYAYRAKVLERHIFRKEVRLFKLIKDAIRGNEDVKWNWEQVVQGQLGIYLGEPARHRRQSNFAAISWQVLLLFILVPSLSIGSLLWGVIKLLWHRIPEKTFKTQIRSWVNRMSGWIAPFIVLILAIVPAFMTFLLLAPSQNSWKSNVPPFLKFLVSSMAVAGMFLIFAILDLVWQTWQADRARRRLNTKTYVPKVSTILFERLYWYVLLINEALIGYGKYFFSLFLDLFTGYGYKLDRSFCTYLIVISTFAIIYRFIDPQLTWNAAVVISMTAFHGRGLVSVPFSPNDPQALTSAIEAFIGLFTEVIFIATLTRRFFER